MTSARAVHGFRTRLFRSAIVLVAIAMSARADALDPSKTLSQYIHRIWQVQQGLPQASIDAIVQTHDGYLWLGTQTGLVKFDGVRFTTIDEIDGLPLTDIRITRLLEDRRGALWIGHQPDRSHPYSERKGAALLATARPAVRFGAVSRRRSGRPRLGLHPERARRDQRGHDSSASTGGDGLSTPTSAPPAPTRDGTLFVGDDNGRVVTWTGDRFTLAASLPIDAFDRKRCSARATARCGSARATG